MQAARYGDADYVIPDGESASAVTARVVAALHAVPRDVAGPVAVVTHGGVITALLRAILGLSPVAALPITARNCHRHRLRRDASGQTPLGWRIEAIGEGAGLSLDDAVTRS